MTEANLKRAMELASGRLEGPRSGRSRYWCLGDEPIPSWLLLAIFNRAVRKGVRCLTYRGKLLATDSKRSLSLIRGIYDGSVFTWNGRLIAEQDAVGRFDLPRLDVNAFVARYVVLGASGNWTVVEPLRSVVNLVEILEEFAEIASEIRYRRQVLPVRPIVDAYRQLGLAQHLALVDKSMHAVGISCERAREAGEAFARLVLALGRQYRQTWEHIREVDAGLMRNLSLGLHFDTGFWTTIREAGSADGEDIVSEYWRAIAHLERLRIA